MRIELDRSSTDGILAQLLTQLRFQISSGRLSPGDEMPSTRALGSSLGISFHTVRKAYQQLEQEGYVGRSGRVFTVTARVEYGLEERLEFGAEKVGQTIRELLGRGLSAEEILTLTEEALEEFEGGPSSSAIVVTSDVREIRDAMVEELRRLTHAQVVDRDLLSITGPPPDVLVTPYGEIRRARAQFPTADVYGVRLEISDAIMDAMARLPDSATMGFICQHTDGVAPLLQYLKRHSPFQGQVVGATLSESAPYIRQVIETSDLLVYTEACHRRIAHFLKGGKTAIRWKLSVAPANLAFLQTRLPRS